MGPLGRSMAWGAGAGPRTPQKEGTHPDKSGQMRGRQKLGSCGTCPVSTRV